MKKTIITVLFALSSASLSSADTLWTMVFSNGAQTDISKVTLTFEPSEAVAGLSGSIDSLVDQSGTTATLITTNARGQETTSILPNTLMNASNSKSWTLTLTFKNEGTSDFNISDFSVDTYAANASGGVQGGNRSLTLSGTLGANTLTATTYSNVGTNREGTGTFTFSTPVTLAAGEEITLALTAAVPSGGGQSCFGVSGMTFNGTVTAVVPEPATTTLSLLALAGLAARRRRK